jgi:uncharacterized peroxidase-related enzyme
MEANLDRSRSFIGIVPDDQWPERDGLAEQVGNVTDRTYGRVDNIMAIHSLNPAGLAAHNALYTSAMTGTATLRKVERELIAYVVSLENHCHYWITHHGRGLRRLLKDDTLFAEFEADWRNTSVSDKRRSMLTYALKLTHTPGEMVPADVEALRTAGFTDRDILDITEVIAYYAYVNRIADGLGVSTEDWIPHDEWRRGHGRGHHWCCVGYGW